MSAEFNAYLLTADDDEAERFVDALADFAMAWSNNVMCTATVKADLENTAAVAGRVKIKVA